MTTNSSHHDSISRSMTTCCFCTKDIVPSDLPLLTDCWHTACTNCCGSNRKTYCRLCSSEARPLASNIFLLKRMLDMKSERKRSKPTAQLTCTSCNVKISCASYACHTSPCSGPLCINCETNHKTIRSLNGHKLVQFDNGKESIKLVVTSDELKLADGLKVCPCNQEDASHLRLDFFCETCTTLLCPDGPCRPDHADHTIILTRLAVEKEYATFMGLENRWTGILEQRRKLWKAEHFLDSFASKSQATVKELTDWIRICTTITISEVRRNIATAMTSYHLAKNDLDMLKLEFQRLDMVEQAFSQRSEFFDGDPELTLSFWNTYIKPQIDHCLKLTIPLVSELKTADLQMDLAFQNGLPIKTYFEKTEISSSLEPLLSKADAIRIFNDTFQTTKRVELNCKPYELVQSVLDRPVTFKITDYRVARFAFDGFEKSALAEIRAKATQLGLHMFNTQSPESGRLTHLISKKAELQLSTMVAIACGAWILKEEFIMATANGQEMPNELDFTWPANYHVAAASAKSRRILMVTNKSGLFEGLDVYIAVDKVPADYTPLEILFKAGHANKVTVVNFDDGQKWADIVSDGRGSNNVLVVVHSHKETASEAWGKLAMVSESGSIVHSFPSLQTQLRTGQFIEFNPNVFTEKPLV